jgi:hypothetical protein
MICYLSGIILGRRCFDAVVRPGGWRLSWFRVSAQSRDRVEQLAAVPNDADAQVLQVFSRQAQQNRVVDLVLAECCLIPFEVKAPQPTSEVHDSA